VREGTKKQAGFNLNSPKQLLDVFTTLIGAVPVDNTGKPSASRAALREYVGDHQGCGRSTWPWKAGGKAAPDGRRRLLQTPW
jgi:hypothetical protein